MGKFKINNMDTHTWDIDELPERPTSILTTCIVCGFELDIKNDWEDDDNNFVISIKPKYLNCKYCQKLFLAAKIMDS